MHNFTKFHFLLHWLWFSDSFKCFLIFTIYFYHLYFEVEFSGPQPGYVAPSGNEGLLDAE